jgi:hypothetical protein
MSMTIRPIFAVAILVVSCLVALNFVSAQPAEINVQQQWIYRKQVDQTTKVQFLATTAAIGDENAWLLLACGEDGRTRSRLSIQAAFPFHSRAQ